MDWSNKQTTIYTNNTRSGVSVYRNLFGTWFTKSHDYSKNNGSDKYHRHHKYFFPVILCLTNLATAPATLAETVGGVSATAAPVANSSGSVTNQAIQVLQGPYITNTYLWKWNSSVKVQLLILHSLYNMDTASICTKTI